jgi:hypothetical protein
VYPNLDEEGLQCDFGGTPRQAGIGGMVTHSAFTDSGPPMLCNFCQAVGCHDCVNLEDNYNASSDEEPLAGPSVPRAGDQTQRDNPESSGNLSEEEYSSLPKSNNDPGHDSNPNSKGKGKS